MSAPTFQHRHYKLIAAAIAAMPSHSPRLRTTREEMTATLVRLFQNDNPQFSEDRFVDAAAGTPSNGRDIVR